MSFFFFSLSRWCIQFMVLMNYLKKRRKKKRKEEGSWMGIVVGEVGARFYNNNKKTSLLSSQEIDKIK